MSVPQHTLELATELLEDVELSRLPVSALILKASRLARLVNDEETQEWLRMEMRGYVDSEVGCRYMSLTGRWADKEARTGCWQGVAEIEVQIEAQTALLSALRLPDLSGNMILPTIKSTREHASGVAQGIAKLAAIRAKVVSLLHGFSSTRYYELAFAEQQAELFEQARQQVDALLAPLSGDTLSKVESIYRRLSEGDSEAISQALSTCRRLIDAVANAIYPPSEETIEVGGNVLRLTEQHVQNRLNVYVRGRTDSESRRKKLRRTLNDLYDRVSTGVHNDVRPDEARFLFLTAYLYLGEILSLRLPE